MAFPSIGTKGTTYNTSGTPTTSHVVDAPASIASGDLLLIHFASDGTGTISTVSGWTELFKVDSPASSSDKLQYKIATGSEGANETITTGGSEQAIAYYWRIPAAEWHGTTPPEYATATGTSANPDPPSVTASWGSDDNLWWSTYGTNGNPSASVYPFADNNEWNGTGGGGSSGSAICTEENATATNNPSAYTMSASQGWVAATVVIRPAGGGGGPAAGFMTTNTGYWGT